MGFITSKFSKLISNTISFLGPVYDITNLNNNNLINMDFEDDWGVTLPLLSTVTNGFKVVISHTTGQTHKGTIVPNQIDIIDGNSISTVYGNGFLTLSKVNNKWVIINKSLFSNYHLEGVTKEYEFFNETEVVLEHNLGYTPITQVLIEDENGILTKANVDERHDRVSKNTYTIYMDTPQSGVILYL
tara:strand:- start:92 stop:652 length:561 start_codon:yes stop_codon:yes gene_type:complete